MLDIGFWEILVLAALALLILGPERLPQVVRTVGRWVRAVRRTATQLRWQIEQELDVNEKPRSPRPPHTRSAGTRSSAGGSATGARPPPPDGLTQRVNHSEEGAAGGQAEGGEAMEEGATTASPTPRPVEGVHAPSQDETETPVEEVPRHESEPSRSETSTH